MVTMGNVWDRTAEFLTDNLAALVPITLIAFFVPDSISGNFAAVKDGATFQLQLVLQLIQLAFALLSMWGSLAIAAMALERGDSGAAGTIARERMLPTILVAIVLCIAGVVLVLPIPAVLAASGVDLTAVAQGAQPNLGAGASAFLVVYGIALGIFFLWAAARLSLTTPIIVNERRGLGAIGQSFRLTRGLTWRLIGVLLLYGLVTLVAVLATQTVFGSIFRLVAGSDGGGVTLATVLTSVSVAAVQTAFTAIVPVFLAKLYLAVIAERGLAGSR